MHLLLAKTKNSFGFQLTAALCLVVFAAAVLGHSAASASAPEPQSGASGLLGSPDLVNPSELVSIFQSAKPPKPLILNVGPRVMFVQAHIPGAEFIGPPGSDPQALQVLRNRVKALPKNKFIVLYCGCCPWSVCPNVEPAYKELRKLGFTRVKVLYLANNLGADWVYRGYPTERGL